MLKIEDFRSKKHSIAVVGLGYVGLPLAHLLSSKFKVIGFDISEKRIDELKNKFDRTGELTADQLNQHSMTFTTKPEELSKASLLIITVPTPIDQHNLPDLKPIKSASEIVGQYLTPQSIIVYESTVYPGLTEEVCVPILEKTSGLKWKKDFFVGYSPERVNPGDKNHTIDKIIKVVSADLDLTLKLVAGIYGDVITAGIHLAPTIKTAEAAKVIENTQRDLNIALMNELSQIFTRLKVSTKDVLAAAKTKWNFLPFEPGLVGGHCIGVDPYYLTFKAKEVNFDPQVILSGRKINDLMGSLIAHRLLEQFSEKKTTSLKILIAGFTFKENISDIRNTKVLDIYQTLKKQGASVDVYDPKAYPEEIKAHYHIDVLSQSPTQLSIKYDAVILAVKHQEFIQHGLEKKSTDLWTNLLKPNGVIFDIKNILNQQYVEEKNFRYLTL